jgi:hypothetical protein
MLGDPGQAGAAFERARALDPANWSLYRDLAVRRVWAALAALWSAIAWDEMSGFEANKDALSLPERLQKPHEALSRSRRDFPRLLIRCVTVTNADLVAAASRSRHLQR